MIRLRLPASVNRALRCARLVLAPFVLIALLALEGCLPSDGGGPPSVDSESHFLIACASDADCSNTACLCGFCTSTCDLASDACPVCVTSGSVSPQCAALLPSERLCAAPCTGDDACGPGFHCGSEDACVPDAVADVGPDLPPGCDHAGFAIAEQTYDLTDYTWNGIGHDNTITLRSAPVGGRVDLLSMTFRWTNGGTGLATTGVVPFDWNPATCTNCIELRTGCLADGSDCGARYASPAAGYADVQRHVMMPPQVGGRVREVRLVEVEDSGDGTLVPSASGATWCLDDVAFDSNPSCETGADCQRAGQSICDAATHTCVGCRGAFDCGAAAPVCVLAHASACEDLAGQCPADDASEPDNGPSVAPEMVAGVPVDGVICSPKPLVEEDWRRLTLPGGESLGARVEWSDLPGMLYLTVFDAAGAVVSRELTAPAQLSREVVTGPLAAGDYYVRLSLDGADEKSQAYHLEVQAFPVECAAEAPCTDPERPYCIVDRGVCAACRTSFDCAIDAPACVPVLGVGTCAMVDACSDDDVPEVDDGPSAARLLVLDEPVDARVCGSERTGGDHEADWYVFDGVRNPPEAVALSATEATATVFDLDVYDAAGDRIGGASTEAGPIVWRSTTGPVGRIYLAVRHRIDIDQAADAYRIGITP